ncbi:MAG: VOC family protein [Oxalicibacterium faecigallinarum]|uniref:Glyoxalase n=1 Tax=Oxalicibacterium faecigallinarum TaxID=573741 RepID=A0A8J3F1C0_9BURK|nr:VOC family protein [Oxalicibacterium faecigallinarum]MDQ7968273.1 VOC family protein [Oxalicibacterium faecigallinarum]GGI19022.1 glyoxalase [Oxalicibacterium faecigallinarum]
MTAKKTTATIIPGMRYRDATAAVDWLCKAFGFEVDDIYKNPDGTIVHAQLTFGNGMIMIGSIKTETDFDGLIRQPDEIGGFETQSPYLIVQDAEAMYARAKAAGATIVVELKFEDYGGQGFSCRDPEGRLWNFGTYDPWL